MKKKNKISILVSGPLPPPLGGMETYCQDFLRTSIPDEFDVTFCRSILIKAMVMASGFCRLLLRCVNRVITLIVWVFMLLMKRPDIVHVHTNSGLGFYSRAWMAIWAEKFGAKAILHMHGGGFREFYDGMKSARQARVRKLLNAVSVLVVLTEEWKSFFLSIEVASERIVVLTNSVFLPQMSEEAGKTEKMTVLYMARIERQKGIYELIDMVENHPEILSKYHFILAGPRTNDWHIIHDRIAKLGLADSLEMPGGLIGDRKDAAFRKAHVFVLQSFVEGLPIGLMEAMSYGLACITTPVGGIPDVIKDKKNGLLIPPGDSEALADSLQFLANNTDRMRDMANNARSDIENEYNWQKRAEDIMSLYRYLHQTKQ